MGHRREELGIKLFAKGRIRRIDQSRYIVSSQSNEDKNYEVTWQNNKWNCTCPDYQKHKKKCKHIFAIHYFLASMKLKQGLSKKDDEGFCPICNSNEQVIKKGKSYTRKGTIQRYYCKTCKKRFQGNESMKKMRHQSEIISTALDLYFKGLSLRQIVQHLLDCHQTKVSHTTIHNWIKRYSRLINDHLEKKKIQSSDKWHADETIVHLNGRHIRLWTVLDSESRFLVATHLSFSRETADADQLLKNAVNKSKNKPSSIATDGLKSYNEAIDNNLQPEEGESLIHLQGPLTAGLNNKMERYNGILKSRTKTLLHLKDPASAETFIHGYNTYYNYIKPHAALDNKTPAEKIGLTSKKLTWLELLEKVNS